MDYDKKINLVQESQVVLSKRIDSLILELQDLSKTTQYINVGKKLDKLNEIKRESSNISVTLSNISDRLNRLILMARKKFPEMYELQKKKQKKETMESIQKSLEETEESNKVEIKTEDQKLDENQVKVEEKLEEKTEEKKPIEVQVQEEIPIEPKKEDTNVLDLVKLKLNRDEKYNEFENLISEEVANNIRAYLPYSQKVRHWRLIYDTRVDGTTLVSFYQNTDDQGPTVLIVKTDENEVFGGFASESWKKSSKYYGTGETFLFRCDPFQVFQWSKKNNYFLFSRDDSIAFGGGGRFGLWLDDEFSYGSGQECATFEGAISKEEDFKVYAVQVWKFE